MQHLPALTVKAGGLTKRLPPPALEQAPAELQLGQEPVQVLAPAEAELRQDLVLQALEPTWVLEPVQAAEAELRQGLALQDLETTWALEPVQALELELAAAELTQDLELALPAAEQILVRDQGQELELAELELVVALHQDLNSKHLLADVVK
jgi:hypothetical protein